MANHSTDETLIIAKTFYFSVKLKSYFLKFERLQTKLKYGDQKYSNGKTLTKYFIRPNKSVDK